MFFDTFSVLRFGVLNFGSQVLGLKFWDSACLVGGDPLEKYRKIIEARVEQRHRSGPLRE